MKTTFERLGIILATFHKVPPDRLQPDASLADLGLDSLATLEMFWNIEEEFGIGLPAHPVALATMGEVADYIDTLLAKQAATTADAAPVIQSAA